MNRIEKNKTALIVISIISLLIGVCSTVGSVFLLISGFTDMTVVLIVFGFILAFLGLGLILFGIYYLWIGCALKATKSSIAVDNSIAMNRQNKVCPKCGATNTPNVDTCQVCGEKLDK